MLSSVVVVSCRRRFLTERGEGSAVEVQFLGYPMLLSQVWGLNGEWLPIADLPCWLD
jgi:hypothetical protein